MELMSVEQLGSLLSSLRSEQTLSQGQLERSRLPDASGEDLSESPFGQALKALSEVQQDSDRAIELLVTGEPVDLHQVMISAERTDIAFRLAVQLRNKLVRS